MGSPQPDYDFVLNEGLVGDSKERVEKPQMLKL